jgi:TPR repeat protein
VGVAQDFDKAVESYNTALSYQLNNNERNIRCLLALAECYELGVGTEQDHIRALSLYKSASEHDDAESMYRTGIAILRGVGMRAEYAAARPFMLRAARKGYIPAMLMMGVFADEGRGIKKNEDDAAHWYSKAVATEVDHKGGNYDFPVRVADSEKLISDARIEAQYRLGCLLAHCDIEKRNYITAFDHISRAAAMGHKDACVEIAKIYLCGGDLKEYYESDFSQRDHVLENGDTVPDKETLGNAMNKLGDAFYDGKNVLAKNRSFATACYKIAAEFGNVDASYSYGWCLRHGSGITENDAEAVKWLKIAADRGNANAAYSYALCCEEGAGTGVKNKREARSYYRKAASSGHLEAAKRFVLLSKQDD